VNLENQKIETQSVLSLFSSFLIILIFNVLARKITHFSIIAKTFIGLFPKGTANKQAKDVF
jgi:hypothetical protein